MKTPKTSMRRKNSANFGIQRFASFVKDHNLIGEADSEQRHGRDCESNLPVHMRNDPLVAIHIPEEEKEWNALEIHAKELQEANVENIEDWFIEGSRLWKVREICLLLSAAPRFNVCFMVVVMANTAVVVFSVDDLLSAKSARSCEDLFNVLYALELIVRSFGCQCYPWLSWNIIVDALLLLLATLDLLFALVGVSVSGPLDVLITSRGVASIVTVIRLFRLFACDLRGRAVRPTTPSCLQHDQVAMAISSFWRPLRLMRRALRKAPTLPVGLFLAVVLAIYVVSLMMRSFMIVFESMDVEMQSFPDVLTTMTIFAQALGGGSANVGVPFAPNNHMTERRIVFFIFCLLYFMLVTVVANLTLGLIVEHILQVGQQDDAHEDMLRQREKTNMRKVREGLRRIDVNMDGTINEDELTFSMNNNPEIDQLLGMNVDDASALLREIDIDRTGKVTLEVFLLAMFRKQVQKKSLNALILDQSIRTSLEEVHNYTREIEKLDQTTRRKTATQCKHLWEDLLERETVQAAHTWEIGQNVSSLEAQLDLLENTLAVTEDCNVEREEDDAQITLAPSAVAFAVAGVSTESVVSVASFRFLAQLLDVMLLVERWYDESTM